jgi:hypothetical protein
MILLRIRSGPRSRFTALVAAVFLPGFGSIQAALINAASASLLDVSSAIASAHDGDTVVVPPGTMSWTSGLTITKGITLQGTTTVKTVGSPPTSYTVNDGTIILDDVPRTSSGGKMFEITLNSSQKFRLTGFTFKYGSLTSLGDPFIHISGTCPSVRVDHCYFNQLYQADKFIFSGWLYGVVDHCVLDLRGGGTGGGKTGVVQHGGWQSYTHSTSYTQPPSWGSWADPPYFGSERFIFFEDNVINNLGTAPNGGSIDAFLGGRYVARYNLFLKANLYYHGSDTGSGANLARGTRAVEIYNNTFINNSFADPAGECRGGTLLWHDNSYNGKYTGGMGPPIYRLAEYAKRSWLGADGTSPWDVNATDSNGNPITYETGTHNNGVNGSVNVTDSTKSWRTNQWAGYEVRNTNPNSPYYHGHNYIVANTSSTLTCDSFTGNIPSKWNNSDTYAISKVLIVLDQPGRGQGDLIVAGNPPAWPHQALEPLYSWNNTLNGKNLNWTSNPVTTILKENVDFYNNKSMPGYTPYTYPHPLVSGVPAAPTNLRVIF